MGMSRGLKEKFERFDLEDADRIIRMAWEDRTSYQAIRTQFGLTPAELVVFMRSKLEPKAFQRWRRRVFQQGHLKNEPPKDRRFKCQSQRLDGSTKNHK